MSPVVAVTVTPARITTFSVSTAAPSRAVANTPVPAVTFCANWIVFVDVSVTSPVAVLVTAPPTISPESSSIVTAPPLENDSVPALN